MTAIASECGANFRQPVKFVHLDSVSVDMRDARVFDPLSVVQEEPASPDIASVPIDREI